ncbi:MAG: helix-turn-helix domain-containing protein [Deltaproteobacteria bacterium]|nr:helix-turn-helix domain-containing protein [Deltaproteobacteria bacterium]
MPTYTTITGEVLEFATPTPEVQNFLARVAEAANDPGVSVSELVGLIYSEENPLLVTGIIPGHGFVTREVHANPVYHVLVDQLSLKRVQLGMLDVEVAHADYTLSVMEAAAELGISTSAVRQAIHAHRLSAVKKGKKWWVHPDSVASYQVSARGPLPEIKEITRGPVGEPLEVVRGSAEGVGLKLWHDGHAEPGNSRGGAHQERVTGWHRAVVLTYVKGRSSARYFDLQPGDEENEVVIGPLEVRGRFRVVQKLNNARKARAAFERYGKSLRGLGTADHGKMTPGPGPEVL